MTCAHHLHKYWQNLTLQFQFTLIIRINFPTLSLSFIITNIVSSHSQLSLFSFMSIFIHSTFHHHRRHNHHFHKTHGASNIAYTCMDVYNHECIIIISWRHNTCRDGDNGTWMNSYGKLSLFFAPRTSCERNNNNKWRWWGKKGIHLASSKWLFRYVFVCVCVWLCLMQNIQVIDSPNLHTEIVITKAEIELPFICGAHF